VSTPALQVVLLVFAGVGFGGAGASMAVSRCRWLAEGERDLGMLGVAAMLGIFGTLCTIVSVGALGVLAYGTVAGWAAYVIMAQHLGLFAIEVERAEPSEPEEAPRSLR